MSLPPLLPVPALFPDPASGPAAAAASAAAPRDDAGAAECDALLARHMEAVRVRFGPAALGVVDLPSLGSGTVVEAQVRVGAVLWWAAELEQAGLLPFVEALAEGVATGAVMEPLGGAVHELVRHWRARAQRFGAVERRALFARVLGDPARAAAAEPVEPRLRALAAALVAIGRERPDLATGGLEARAAVQAQELGALLSARAVGMAAFAARDVVAQVRTALALLRHPDLSRTLGGGTPWMMVSRHAPALLGRPVRVQRHLSRAQAGMRILAWIAGQAARLDGGALRIPRNAPVVREAEAWSAAAGEG